MAVHLFAPQSYDFPSNYQKKFRNSLSIPDLFTVYLCYLSDCHYFTTYRLGCFLGVPTGEALPRISFLLREGNVLRP